jgi:hypothetical protein
LSFEILVGGGVPCYLDGIFDLAEEACELKFNIGGLCGGIDITRPHQGKVHEMAVSTYLKVHDGPHSDVSARLLDKGLQMSFLTAMRVAAVELAHVPCFP